MKKYGLKAVLFFFVSLVFAIPPRPGMTGPHTCIIGPMRSEPKDLRDLTIETCAILVQFSDNLADTVEHSPARYDSMFYSVGVYQGTYRAGSLNDFFIENSYGVTDVAGGIAADQWHMSDYSYSHYYDGYYMLTTGYELARDAVDLVDPLVDFSQYDANGDNHIDGVFVIHAGPGGEDTGNTDNCWSHAMPYFNYTTDDGITIDGATNVPEINLVTPSLDTTLCCIGVMCHELGHIVGLPDLYDGSRNTWGVGYWSLMSYGAWGAGGNTPWSPSHADGWCKMEVNWLTPTPITQNMYNLRILDQETHPVAYRVWRNGVINDTFFILENRKQTGFDAPLPGAGLLIWHIDPRYSSYHNIVDLEEADGCDDLDNGWGYRPDPHYYHPELGDAGDPFPGDSNTTVFDSLSYPSSNDNWGNPTHVTVRNIALIGDTVVCDVIIDPSTVTEHSQRKPHVLLTVSPNPFSKLTNVSFEVDSRQKSVASIRIYDIAGRMLKSFDPMPYALGSTHIRWDGTDQDGHRLPSGVYFVELRTNDFTETEKVLLVR